VKNILKKAMAQKGPFPGDDDYTKIFPAEYMGNILVIYEAI
jgi:hypothetical protein